MISNARAEDDEQGDGCESPQEDDEQGDGCESPQARKGGGITIGWLLISHARPLTSRTSP
jgi:hypothetical protein